MKTAKLVRPLEDGWQGDARLYELSEPVPYGHPEEMTSFVIVSAAYVRMDGRDETYIFPADAEGEILDWLELDGSFKGAQDHARALRGAGFEPTEALAA